MDGLGERARRAAERREHLAESVYLKLGHPAGPAVQAARFIRGEVWERFRVSGDACSVLWLVAPPCGSVARVLLERRTRLVCVIEAPDLRRRSAPPRCRFWVDAWPGAVEVYTLADLAGLVDEPVAA